MVGPSVLVVKTHSDLQCFQATIHLLRSPTDAIVSEWNRHTGEKGTTGSKHTAIASPSQFGMLACYNIYIVHNNDKLLHYTYHIYM